MTRKIPTLPSFFILPHSNQNIKLASLVPVFQFPVDSASLNLNLIFFKSQFKNIRIKHKRNNWFKSETLNQLYFFKPLRQFPVSPLPQQSFPRDFPIYLHDGEKLPRPLHCLFLNLPTFLALHLGYSKPN